MDLAERIALLERSNLRMRRTLVLAAGLGHGWTALGSAPGPGAIEATRTALVDVEGRERAVLEMAEGPPPAQAPGRGRPAPGGPVHPSGRGVGSVPVR